MLKEVIVQGKTIISQNIPTEQPYESYTLNPRLFFAHTTGAINPLTP
jgi:hypothetical protein